MKVHHELKYCLLMLLFCLGSMAVHAQSQEIDIHLKNASLKQVFSVIEKQTTYRFSYRDVVIDDRSDITISKKAASVQSVLTAVLAGRNLSFTIVSPKSIVIAGKSPTHAAQARKGDKVRLTGRVVDENGEPIIGATVKLKGSSAGAISDLDGNFAIEAVPGTMLEVSYIGYQTKLVSARPGNMNIGLAVDRQNLDEVIVIGYGSSTRRDLISSVSTVKADQISNIPVANISQGLAGRSPGLIVQASGGGINSLPSVSIRGGGSPLYVIDGIVRSSADFQNLSADDIESMSILKDASATAVYGARASNGIIQVTTKRGKTGKISIEYDLNYSLAQPSIWPQQMHSYDRAKYANIARANDGLEPIYSEEAIKAMRDGSQPVTYNDTNWRKLVLDNWAPQQKHTVRMTGGGENHNFYISLGHIDQNSLYKTRTHWMKRTNFRISETSYIRPIHLQVNATIDGYRQETSHPYTSTSNSYFHVFSHINNKSPMLPGVNKYGLPYNMSDNPVAETAKDAGYNRHIANVINGKGELIWSCPWVGGLKARVASNYRYYGETSKQWRKDAAQYDYESDVPQYANQPLLYHSSPTGYSFTNQAFVEYAQTFGKHNVSALGGFEQYYQKTESYWEQREKYDFDIDQMNVGPSNGMTNGGSEAELGRAAWIGQLKYNYGNKYYAEASLRYDGSDYFAPGKRWGAFYSGSLGWVVTEESFMKSLVERNILNSLKLRVSYGETGLDSSAGRFAYLTSYNLDTKAYVVDGSYVPGFTEGRLASPDLTWYTTQQTDVGFDFASLSNRLYGSFDYFYYSTKGYLTAPTGKSYLNSAIGIGMPQVKSKSEYRRAGWEFQLGWRDRIGQLNYDISANFTYFDELWARNESEAESSYMNPYIRTQQQKGYYGTLYHHLGYYSSAEDIYNSPGVVNALNSGNLAAGDLKYEDTNGNGYIDSGDIRRLGKSHNPRGQFGINMNFNYKGFYLSMLFQGSTAFDMKLVGPATMKTDQTGSLMVAFDYQTDYWTPANRNAQYPRLMSNTNLNANNNYLDSDFWLINGSYLRMKDFQFGYDLKYSLLRNVAWLAKARVGISGQNIFTISQATKYGLDPENSSTTGYGYPVERVLALTVNLGF